MPPAVPAPSLSPEEITEIQNTEIEALQTILDDDFRRVEHKAWKSASHSQPHEFDITLRPDEERLKPLVSAVLNVKLPKNYPTICPILSIKIKDDKTKGLSTQDIHKLNDALNAKARTLIGAEMIWELVSLGQELISHHNQVPREVKDGAPSLSLEEEKRQRALEEERKELERRQEERLRKLEAETVKTNQLAQLIEQEASKKAMVLRREKEKKRASTVVSQSFPISPKSQQNGSEWISSGGSSERIETFMEPIEENGRVTSVLRVGPVLEKTHLSVRHLAEPAHDDPSDTNVARSWILEHYFITSVHYAYSSGKRKIEDVEYELDKLAKIREPSLVNVLASAVTRMGDNQGWKLSVVSERCHSILLRDLLDQCDVLPWKRARLLLSSLLQAVDVLHTRNLLHRDIGPSSVHVESGKVRSEPAEARNYARLRDNSYLRRLKDMHKSNPLNDLIGPLPVDDRPDAWKAPESVEQPLTYTRKRDLWDLGVCACQMLFGLDCYLDYDTPEQLIRTQSDLEPHIQGFLMLMLERSPKRRPTAAALLSRLEEIIVFEDQELSHGSSTQIPAGQRAQPGPVLGSKILQSRPRTDSHPGKASPNAEAFHAAPKGLERPGTFWPLRHPTSSMAAQGLGVSRYLADFEEVEFLGKGAFGSVVKARNRLDGRFYAVKKIKLSSSVEEDERTLREIAALSRLDHPHIVRYSTCWIEETQMPITGLLGSDTDSMAASQTLETNTTHTTNPSGPSLASVKATGKFKNEESFRAVPDFDDDFLSSGRDPFSNSASLADIRFGNDDSDDESDNSGQQNARGASVSCSRSSESDSDTESESDEDSSSDEDEGYGDDDFSRIPVSSRRESKAGLSMSGLASNRGPIGQPPVQRVLYIQMEFVENRTLREAIEKGVSEDEAWRILRQMVEALAHISSLGIIHRDLKPSNVLMYANGDVKIGDFGLATNALQITDGGGGPAGAAGTADLGDSTDLTGDLGTFLYTAPELRAKKGAKYNFKVDIYSLGIIFFEMLASQRVYTTGMERILLIRELRTPSISLPSSWPRSKYEKQTALIRQMLDHNPDQRPSPVEILKSDLLPPKMEDEYIEECLRLMSNPSSAYNHQLMDALFGRTGNDLVRDFTFDTGAETDQDSALIGVVCDLFRSVCRKHGAVEFSAPLMVPPNGLYTSNEKVVQMLDKTGRVVQLPYDLTVPFARIFARSENQRFKRYEINKVYRENVVAGGQPRAVIASTFDIVSPERSAAAEAEALAVVEEVLDEIPGVSTENWVININHESILALILERVPSKQREAVLGVIALLSGSKTVNSARSQLLKLGLPRSTIEELEAFNIHDDVKVVHQRLERLFPVEHRPRVSRAVAEISEVIETAQDFGVQRKFIFCPLLAQSSVLYRGGVLFTVVRAGKRRDVVAAGGRYDSLLKRFSNPSSTPAPAHGVGVQIAVGKLTLGLAKHQEVQVPRLLSRPEEERSFGLFTPRRCDVYVASAPGLLKARMEICRELWAHNIAADLQYEHATYDTPESAAATCRSEGILMLVFVKARSPVLKVKTVLQRVEYEVPRHELVTFIQERIARQRSIDTQVSGQNAMATPFMRSQNPWGEGGQSRFASSTAGVGSSALPFIHSHHHHSASRAHSGTDVLPSFAIQIKEREMVLPERPIDRSKKGDKSNQYRPKPSSMQLVLDKASRQVSRFADQLQAGNIPVLAVDFTGTSFDRLAAALMACLGSHATSAQASGTGGWSSSALSARQDDDGSLIFRSFLEGLTAEEKDYAKLVKKKAIEFAFSQTQHSTGGGLGHGRVFLYSLREDRAVLVGCGR